MLDKITPEEHAQFKRQMDEDWAYSRWLEEQGKEYGTDTSISLDILREAGHFPIAICTMMCEETFVFKTEAAANKAWKNRVLGYEGWWYGKRNFLKAVKEYEQDFEKEIKIYYL